MIAGDELDGWLRLLATPGVSRGDARRLLAAFGSPTAAVGASRDARERAAGPAVAAALDAPLDTHAALLAATLAWLAAADDADGVTRDVVVLGDPRYPARLLETADPPLLLHVHGRIELLQADCIAVVGSRNPTPQGTENARAFAAYLGKEGWAIASGMARGIDGAAHAGALDAGAATIAVVGTGLDRVYPRSHQALAHRIATHGLLVSEFPIGTPPLPRHFPLRNRILAGMSRGTLVVEAALQSGSLITARLAAEAGREVFAIPGSIHAPQSRGCHALIKQGAKLVESGADVLDELPGHASTGVSGTTDAVQRAEPDVAPATTPLLDALGHDPMALDELVDRTGESAARLSAQLLDLELAGTVARLPGQRFQRISRA